MDDWQVVGDISEQYRHYRSRYAEAIEENLSRVEGSIRKWAARELTKGRVPADDYGNLLTIMGAIACAGDVWDLTWIEAKLAAGLKNWVYLNGRVEFSERPFEALRSLAGGEGNQEAGALANHWLAGNQIIPHGHKDAIAMGELTPDNHVLILNTNVDRNKVRDAVLTQQKVGSIRTASAWDMSSIINNREQIEREYAALMASPQPHLQNPHVQRAWKDLAGESKHYSDYIRQHVKVEPVANGEPYATTQDMFDDIQKNRHFYVSNLNAEHPLHSVDDIVNLRTAHDIFGHAATGGDFGWDGEARACSTHHALSSPTAAAALTTECLGQTAWALKNGFEGLTQHPGFLDQAHSTLMQANQNTPQPTKEQLLQMALTPKQAIPSRQSSPIGPIQKSPHGPSPWSPEGQQQLFTLGIGNTNVSTFISWVQEHAPSMIQFMRAQDSVGIFEGSPATSVAVRLFDVPLSKARQFLDFYGLHHPEEWGFGLEWGTGSTVYQNKSNDGSVAEGNLAPPDNKSREDDEQSEIGVNKEDDWAEAPNTQERIAAADLNGTMVALDVPPEYHGALRVPGGERPDNLHVTLAYLPNGVQNPSGVANLLSDVAGRFGPARARIQSLGEFPETKDKDVPQIAHLEGDSLHELHQAVASGLKGLGEDVSEKHDFSPHITLKYTRPGEEFNHPNPDIKDSEIQFPAIHLHQGGDKQEFQLGKSPVFASVKDDWTLWT